MRGELFNARRWPGVQRPEDCGLRRTGGLLALELELEVSGECRCPACESAPEGMQPVLSPTRRTRWSGKPAMMGCRRCIFVNDGVTACVELRQLIDETRHRGMQVDLFTSGAGITPEMADFLCRNHVAVSLKRDSLNRDLQNQIAGDESAHDTITAALAGLKQAGYGSPGHPIVAIRTAVREENFAELPNLWRWVRSQGMEPCFQVITPRQGDCQPPKVPVPDAAKRLFADLAKAGCGGVPSALGNTARAGRPLV